MESADFRAEISLYSGLTANLIFAVFKGVSGVYYRSTWLGGCVLSCVRCDTLYADEEQERSVHARLKEEIDSKGITIGFHYGTISMDCPEHMLSRSRAPKLRD